MEYRYRSVFSAIVQSELGRNTASSIIGTNSVDLEIDGKLYMLGSIIANVDEEGNDKGNLKIVASSREWNDLHDYEYYTQSGFSFSTIFDLGGSKTTTTETVGTITELTGITSKGWKDNGFVSIYNDFKNFPKNFEIVAGYTGENLNTVINAVQEGLASILSFDQ
jgi:hypothetical protein